MPQDPSKLFAALNDWVREQSGASESFRSMIRELGQMLLEASREGEAAPPPHPNGPAKAPEPIARDATTLRVGDAQLTVSIPRYEGEQAPIEAQPIQGPRVVEMPRDQPGRPEATGYTEPADLAMIVKRSRLKVEGCRWAALRRRRIAEGADFETAIASTDRDLFDRAKALPRCYMWMLDPYGVGVPDDETLRTAEAAHENLALAAQLVADLLRIQSEDDEESVPLEAAVRLLAEAQSALRIAMTRIGLRGPEQDQYDTFTWLREFTYSQRIFIDRHMRLDDPADPDHWADLQERIEFMREDFEQQRTSARRRRSLLNKARYHAGKLPGSEEDWIKMFGAIDELVADGVPPSDLEIRELLLSVWEHVPESIEIGDGAERALVEVDRYLASREQDRERAPAQREPSPEVRRAAELLRGKGMVLIGGEERPFSRKMLERDLELSHLSWLSAAPHKSVSVFEPEIARDDTHVVILAIRWSSHSFENVKEMCERYGKPFVRLPGGYGVNQVAKQIVDQVSEQLAAAGA